MKLVVSPGRALRGEATPPGDKSLSHRAALFAALAEGESRIENFLVAGVTEAMLNALTALGVPWRLEGTTLWVQGRGLQGLRPPDRPIRCGNSATTLRLLTGALAAAGIPVVLEGSPGLSSRPMKRIVEPLQAMGVPIRASAAGTAPLVLEARAADGRLRSIEYTMPVASAQVKSCLLLAAMVADGTTTVHEPGPSRDYTERMLTSMGMPVHSYPRSDPVTGQVGFLHTLTPPEGALHLSPLNLALPGDISSAAFLIVAALIVPGSQVTLRGIGLNPTRTGLLDALGAMKADIEVVNKRQVQGEEVGDLVIRSSRLQATQVNGSLVVRMVDEIPVFSVAAAYAGGKTVVSQAQELRFKESDRIGVLSQELKKLGVDIHEFPDGFAVEGGRKIQGGSVCAHGDHRLAMSLAVAGLGAGSPIEVVGAELIAESFPSFVDVLCSLGAHVEERGD